jgi:hypothetical protein
MTKISSSPERHTVQVENAIKRAEEKNEEVPEHYLEFWKTAREQDEANLVDPEWQKENLEYDLRSTEWICNKVKANDNYAQNLYAAMCNNNFIKREVWPMLKGQTWGCSWRHAGGIIADMQEKGDYIDWYCSGISGGDEPDVYNNIKLPGRFVPESTITDEIREDLFKLGWDVADNTDND